MNINGLFAHSLTDLIRGIRQNKKNEQSYIAKEIADIRLELRRNDPDLKAQAIAKLTYVSQHKIYAYTHKLISDIQEPLYSTANSQWIRNISPEYLSTTIVPSAYSFK